MSLYPPVKSTCNFCELKLFILNRSAPINIIAEDEEKFWIWANMQEQYGKELSTRK